MIIVRRLGVSGTAGVLWTPRGTALGADPAGQPGRPSKQLIRDRRVLPLTCLCGADISTCYFAVTNRGGVYKSLFISSQFTQLQ